MPAGNPPAPLQIGETVRFWVTQNSGSMLVDAMVLRMSEHAYWVFESGFQPPDDSLDAAIATFETEVWPTVTGVFGEIVSPGVDDDPRLVILHARLSSGAAGYFSGNDAYPNTITPGSNQRDMIYMSIDRIPVNSRSYLGVLAHELQHAIHFRGDPNEDSWLNEGMSEVAATLAGYSGTGFTPYLRSPETSLTSWALEITQAAPDYSAASLFVQYLHDQYGGPDMLAYLVEDQAEGMDSIDNALAELGYNSTSIDIFADWLVANYLDDPEGRFSYPLHSLGPVDTQPLRLTAGTESTVPAFGARYFSVAAPGETVTLSFHGDAASDLLPVEPYSGDHCWWTNAGDSIDSRLTASLDLSDTQTATLEYRVWYDIEELWDYAYVEVSTDDGKTWSILPTGLSTGDNRNATAYGSGLTGQSLAWRTDSVDLSAYAGQRILLRIEYITDDAVHSVGACFDDFSVPEIGWSDDAETAGSWEAIGFARVNNLVPTEWLVQVIRVPSTRRATVERLPVSASGLGELILSDLEPDEELIVVVSAVTPSTTAPVSFTISAS